MFYVMKINIQVEHESLIEADTLDQARDIAQDVWVDVVGDLSFDLVSIEKVN